MSYEEFPTDEPAVVTCGLPYANGDLHIGHLRTYVGGDVFSRALETLGQETAFVCGSDMHGAPIALNAQQQGVSPEEFALDWHERFGELFPRFDVDFDNYGHTHDESNRKLTLEIVERLIEEGYVYEKAVKVAWDAGADQLLPDRYVEGDCPYCGANARGDECDEGCGRHLEPGEIEDPVSTISGNPAEYRERTHKFFRVSELAEYLSGFLDRMEGTANASNQPRQWIEDGLQDWCITRDLEWGFTYPGEADLVLYVWVDAPIEYVSSTKQYTERVGPEVYDWEETWREDGDIVHIIGRDIIQHHTIFWPAMLHVAGYNEPRAVVASGFMSLEGNAFSTSRNRAVWAKEYLAEGFHPDLLRYYLTTVGGFQDDIDFSWERFKERVNGELLGNVGNFAYRSLLFAHRNWGGTPGVGSGTSDNSVPLSDEIEERIEDAVDAFRAGVNGYSTRTATAAGVELAGFGNEYIQRNEPWKLVDEDEERAAQVIRDCVQIVKAVAVLLSPVLSGKAEVLWSQLGQAGSVHEAEIDAVLEAPPADFDDPEELFERIEDERVAELTAKLEQRVADATGETGDGAEGTEDDAAEGDKEVVDEREAHEAEADKEVVDEREAHETEADKEVVDEREAHETEADKEVVDEREAHEAEGDKEVVDEREAHETEADELAAADLKPLAGDSISFDEFQALDLRVAEILTADPIEGADELVRLEVDLGVEERQLVAGLRQLHDVEALPGTKIVVVANLETAELFGVESNGMLLAAGEAADLLTTYGNSPPGTKVE